jgi:hypothetical protein
MENKPKIVMVGMPMEERTSILAQKIISEMDIVFLDEAPDLKTINEIMKPEPFIIKAHPILEPIFIDKKLQPKKKRKGNNAKRKVKRK